MQYTITPAALVAGSQQKTTMPTPKLAVIRMLSTPNRSAISIGSMRPTTEVALMIESE
jgi:hypothetical protein